MNKELIDRAWQALPAEFRKEVREKYRAAKVLSKNTSDIFYYKCELLEHLFGEHNLTSDAEPEEMLCVGRNEVQKLYDRTKSRFDSTNNDLVEADLNGRMNVLESLFGSKCLPPAPEQPKPKYKVGDRMAIKYINMTGIIEEVLGYNEKEDGIYYRLIVEPKGIATAREENLTPYTAPTDKAEGKELDLTQLLKGHEGEKFYCTMFGEVPFVCIIPNPKPFEKPIKVDAFQLTSDGKYGLDGECILFPSRALYEQYPLEPQRAWAVWSEQQKPKRWRANNGDFYWCVDSDGSPASSEENGLIYDDRKYSVGNYFRTESDAEYAAQEVKKCLELVQEEISGKENG